VHWYLVICMLMIYPFMLVYIGKKHRINVQKQALQIAWFILLFFMSMRSLSVGVDTKYYAYVFEQIRRTPLNKVATIVTYAREGETWVFNFEKGYRFYNKLVGFFFHSQQGIVIMNSFVIMILLYWLIRNYSQNYFLSIWLYLTLGIFQTHMNVSRNAIAILICYHAMKYIPERNWKKYALFICLAATIHKSVLLFLPLYFLLKRPACKGKTMLLIIIGFVIAGVGLAKAGPYIENIIPFGSGEYLMASNEKSESLMVGGLYVAIVMFVWIMMKKKERAEIFSVCPIGSWLFLLNLCSFGTNISLKMAARVAALFGTYIIIFVPNIIESIQGEKRKEFVTICVIVGCGIQYILRMLINNIGGTQPYTFFW